uniref:Cytochrome p450 n=1 Tax=Moniliophthora roreri TaxID=221103 RepID=A0A0W0F7E9_MONRR
MGITLVDIAATGAALISLTLLYLLNRRKNLNFLRGPEGDGYLLGVEYQLRTEQEVGDLTFKWAKEYGTTYRMPGCYGENILATADPRALHYILHQNVVEYPTSSDVRRIFELMFGRGVLWAVGDEHRKHRRVLSPAFSINHMKTFSPIFQKHVSHLADKWNTELAKGTQTLDVIPWFHKVTLDVIGESSFNYHFDALDNKPNELTETLRELENLGASPSPASVLIQASLRYIPSWFSNFQHRYFPAPVEKIADRYLTMACEKAREVMRESGLSLEGDSEDEKAEEMVLTGKEKDVLSILVKANRAENPRKRLTEDEVLSQMSTLIQAGHHTTGNSLAWIIYEFSRHPEDQEKIFKEIKAIRDKTGNNGEFMAQDYDSMEWLTVCVKEALRLHPVLPQLLRQAQYHDSIPLEFPVISSDGKTITEVPVKPGQQIRLDIAIDVLLYRLESVWGPDANEWNPSRFLNERETEISVQVGMTANILSFSGGPKGCIGFRFALMEMHALLAGIIERFEFSLPEGIDIKRANIGMMIPRVEPKDGPIQKEPKLPLNLRARV